MDDECDAIAHGAIEGKAQIAERSLPVHGSSRLRHGGSVERCGCGDSGAVDGPYVTRNDPARLRASCRSARTPEQCGRAGYKIPCRFQAAINRLESSYLNRLTCKPCKCSRTITFDRPRNTCRASSSIRIVPRPKP